MELKEWYFYKGDIEGASSKNCDLEGWEKISVPHSWNAEDAQLGGQDINDRENWAYYRGIGWYRTEINMSQLEDWGRIFVRFGAAGSKAKVFLDGNYIGSHTGPYSAFIFELTPFLSKGLNYYQLAVQVDNSYDLTIPPLAGDFVPFGGLKRPVFLIQKRFMCISPLNYASSGVNFIQRQVTDKRAEVIAQIYLSNHSTNISKIDLKVILIESDDSEKISTIKSLTVPKDKEIETNVPFRIIQPHLWNGREDPYLYTARVEIWEDGKLLDRVEENLGIRYFSIHKRKGFYLNGISYPLRGISRHQDRLDKASAVSKEDHEQDHKIIYDMGANTVRTGHYQQSNYFYELCDRSGILVLAEIPLVNEINFDPEFLQNTQSMMMELIHQNFNHPSIFAWGAANELGFRQQPRYVKKYYPYVKRLVRLVKREDPSRINFMAVWLGTQAYPKLMRLTQAFGINAYPGWYDDEIDGMSQYLKYFNLLGGLKGLALTEYGAGGSIHHHTDNPVKVDPKGKWHPEEYQSLIHEKVYSAVVNAKFVWASYVWNSFDFTSAFRDEGDTPGRNDKGLVTYDRKIKKDAYFFYQANWSKNPMVYITSRRFSPRKNASTTIKVYSNCERVELSINKIKMGTMEKKELGIFIFSRVILSNGPNVIEVSAFSGDLVITDMCVWTLIASN